MPTSRRSLRRLAAISLFSGCGSLDLGAEQTGEVEVVWASDLDPYACETYRRNLGAHIVEGDVCELSVPDVECDLLLAGPPCQDFSTLWNHDGARTARGNLFREVARFLAALQPAGFVLENVPGLLSANRGAAWTIVRHALRAPSAFLHNAPGPRYDVSAQVIDMAELGVPQHRERLVVLGVRRDLDVRPPIIPTPTAERPLTVWDALDANPIPEDAPNHERGLDSPEVVERLKLIPPGKNYEVIPDGHPLAVKGLISHVYLRLDPEKPSYTIIANGGGGTHGVWRLEVRARLRRVRCPEHGVHVEGVPFARDGARFTRDFDDLVAWLVTKSDQTATCRLVRIDWDTVGRIIKRVGEELLPADRLTDLFEISLDEVAWRKGHRYLTLVGDHLQGCVVWGTEGKGQAAADEFFAELDPPSADPPRQRDGRASWEPELAIMVPFGPGPTVPLGEGIEGAWLQDGLELDPRLCARASRLRAVSMDMTGGYAKSVREHAPQATIVIDNYHVVALATKALDEIRREHWNELRQSGQADIAKQFKADRWSLLKNPEDLTDSQAATLALIRAGGGKLARAWR